MRESVELEGGGGSTTGFPIAKTGVRPEGGEIGNDGDRSEETS